MHTRTGDGRRGLVEIMFYGLQYGQRVEVARARCRRVVTGRGRVVRAKHPVLTENTIMFSELMFRVRTLHMHQTFHLSESG